MALVIGSVVGGVATWSLWPPIFYIMGFMLGMECAAKYRRKDGQ